MSAGTAPRAAERQLDRASCTLRRIRPADDAEVAAVIREVMPEFGAGGPGFAFCDAEVDAMWSAYQGPDRAYWVVEQAGRVLGGGGFAPLEGGPPGVCELKKMYFSAAVRGLGLGSELARAAIVEARRAGFSRMYLETLATMRDARELYARLGFEQVGGPVGCTGHSGCDTYYALDLGSSALT